MNSSFNVSTTNSTESRMNHSSSLPNLNSTAAAPSGLLPSLLLTPGFQNMSLRNGRRVFQSLDSSYMPDANPTGRGLQQQIPSPPLTPAPNQQMNLLNPHSTNMMINSSVILPSPTPSPPAQTPSPVGVIRMSSNTTPPPSSQMNYSMINSSFTTNSPPPATSEMQSFSMLPPLTTTHSTNMMINSSVILTSPTPSPPAQTHSPVGVIRMSSNTTPPPSSQMNYSMINSSFTTNSPPPATSDMQSFSMLPPLTTTSSNDYFSAPSTSYGELLNGSDYLLQNMRDPPPPYPTAALNNQTEATYATLSSVPPLFHLADIPSTSSALEQYGISYAPGFHGFNARLHDFSHIISSDDGIGTSIESSRETSPEPTNGFSSVSSGDESMNGERGSNMPGLSGNSMSDPCSSSPSSPVLIPLRSQRGPICNTCGQYLKKINGEYQCQICNAAREEKRRKRKKAQSTNNKKNENICCNNCETQVTSLWRRDTNGRSLCNACGLYYKLHSKHRPKNMRKDTIQKRIRKPRNNEAKSPKKEPQSPPSDVSPSFATVNASVVPYSLPSTSSNVQSTFFYTTPTSAAGMTNSYQLPSFQIQNVNPSYMLNNPEALAENSDQDSYTQYSMMQL